jgi:phospholipid/cholesterol/gamma-HCH transport system permease protein
VSAARSPQASFEQPSASVVGMLGAAVLTAFRSARDLYSVFARTLYYTAFGRREPGATLRQMFEIGNRSVVFLTVTMGCIGMILVYQAGLQTRRVVPDFTLIGATYLELLTRDLAASIGSLMLATRVGAGIAAEIGSMVVTEQVDALRMCAADPIDYLLRWCSSSGLARSCSLRGVLQHGSRSTSHRRPSPTPAWSIGATS